MIFFSGCIISLRRPLIGVITYIFIYMTASNSAWWYRILINMGFRFSLIAGVFLVVSLVINLTALRPGTLKRNGVENCFILFIGVIWLSTVTGIGVNEKSWGMLDKMTKTLIFALIMPRIVFSLKDYQWVRWTWVLCGLFLGYQAYGASYGMFENGRLSGIGGGDFEGSSGFSAHIAVTLAMVGITFLLSERHWQKTVAMIAGALCVWALILSQTRSAFLAVIVGAGVAIIRSPEKIRKRFLIYCATGLLIAGMLAGPSFWNRMDTIGMDQAREEASAGGRLEIWAASYFIMRDYPWGVGIGRFQDVIGEYVPEHSGIASHNTFVRCYTDLGIQGFLVYMLIIFFAFKTLHRVRKTAKEFATLEIYGYEAFALEVALVMAFVAGFFNERTYTEGYWILFSMTVCIGYATEIAKNEIDKSTSLTEDEISYGKISL